MRNITGTVLVAPNAVSIDGTRAVIGVDNANTRAVYNFTSDYTSAGPMTGLLYSANYRA